MTNPYGAPTPMTQPAGPQNLELPLRGATISQAANRFFKKYATFSGRASRSEYWWWALVAFLVEAVFQLLSLITTGSYIKTDGSQSLSLASILQGLWGLATIIPALALSVRRLHDVNRSGWWLLIGLVVVIGWIVLFVFHVSGPNPDGTRFDRQTATY